MVTSGATGGNPYSVLADAARATDSRARGLSIASGLHEPALTEVPAPVPDEWTVVADGSVPDINRIDGCRHAVHPVRRDHRALDGAGSCGVERGVVLRVDQPLHAHVAVDAHRARDDEPAAPYRALPVAADLDLDLVRVRRVHREGIAEGVSTKMRPLSGGDVQCWSPSLK